MIRNLLPFAVPAYHLYQLGCLLSPSTYTGYEQLPLSPHADAVKNIAQRVFKAEQVAKPPALKTVVSPPEWEGSFMARSPRTGYLGLQHDINPEELPWVATHELSHLLCRDTVHTQSLKMRASLTTTVITVLALRWPLTRCITATVGLSEITELIASRKAEIRADVLANKHGSKQELEAGIAHFQYAKFLQKKGAFGSGLYLFHETDDLRIAKIRKVIAEKYGSGEESLQPVPSELRPHSLFATRSPQKAAEARKPPMPMFF